MEAQHAANDERRRDRGGTDWAEEYDSVWSEIETVCVYICVSLGRHLPHIR